MGGAELSQMHLKTVIIIGVRQYSIHQVDTLTECSTSGDGSWKDAPYLDMQKQTTAASSPCGRVCTMAIRYARHEKAGGRPRLPKGQQTR